MRNTYETLPPWSGFVEPAVQTSRGGFAVRGVGHLRLTTPTASDYQVLTCRFKRSTPAWPWTSIRVSANNRTLGILSMNGKGESEKKFTIPPHLDSDTLTLSFRLLPRRLLHAILSPFLPKPSSPPLARDSLLLKKVTLGDDALLDYDSHSSRFFPDLKKNAPVKQLHVIGFFRQAFGLAEACRRTTTAVQTVKLPHALTQAPFLGKHNGTDFSIKAENSRPSDNSDEYRLFHFNGDHADAIATRWGEGVFSSSHSIGFWHWELPDFPDEHLSWFARVREVWTPTNFVRDAIAAKSPVPVQVIPLALDPTYINPPPPDRLAFKLPSDSFLFLVVFDYYSSLERKNPLDAIQAFAQLLDTNPGPVHLVVKTNNPHADLQAAQRLQARLDALPPGSHTLIEDTLPRHDLLLLVNSCDALLSLHRAEGFGLHLAEAMAMGKPVVATNWSGNVDFMDETNAYPVDYDLVELLESHGPYSKGNHWAQPKLKHAVKQMRLALKHVKAGETGIQEAARHSITERHAPEKVGCLIRNRLLALDRLHQLNSQHQQPKN